MMSEEQIDEMLDHMMKVGKYHRQRDGYKSETFVPVANVIGPSGEQGLMPLRFKNNKEKYMLTAALSAAARDAGAAAIAIVTDVRYVLFADFCKHFRVAKTADYQEAYLRILNDQFGGEMVNLPRELWREALTVAIKGPHIVPARMKMAFYREGAGDTVEWYEDSEKFEEGKGYAEFGLIPDWWDEGRPN
jgi:hypothetical protein